MRDLVNNIRAATALNPQAVAASAVNGAIIDTKGFGSLAFAVTAGTITDGAYAATLTVGDASDLSDGAAAAAGDILGTLPSFAATDDGVTKKFGYRGPYRYARLTLTPTGATNGGVFSGLAVLGHPASAPVA